MVAKGAIEYQVSLLRKYLIDQLLIRYTIQQRLVPHRPCTCCKTIRLVVEYYSYIHTGQYSGSAHTAKSISGDIELERKEG